MKLVMAEAGTMLRRWTPTEDASLMDELAYGLSLEQIAEIHDRTLDGITRRIRRVKSRQQVAA